MQLSKHFELAEFTRSSTAKRAGISNKPTEGHIANMRLLCEKILEPIRTHFARPSIISSGYRSAALNAVTPGASSTSQHSSGEAVDIDMDGTNVTNAQIFNYIKDNLEFDQLIWEFGTATNPNWVHVSYESNGRQRKQILRAVKRGGRTVYQAYQ
jgi:D-alanyl-D-alanine dipeptidase